MIHEARAPGKLFLFGEYAVLGGAPALVIASSRSVRARLREDAGGYELIGAPPAYGAADWARRLLAAAGAQPRLADRLRVDVSELYDASGAKLGLGSSAASAAAIVSAARPELTGHPLFVAAATAHAAIQEGRGSHADVAAACYGGLIGYAVREPVPPLPRLAAAPETWDEVGRARLRAGLALPPDLRVVPVWMGRPASSVGSIAALERALAESESGALVALYALAQIAREALAALERADMVALVVLAARADAALEALGASIGRPIAVEAHKVLRRAMRPFGVAAKVSGAGGGDFSLLFGPRDLDWPRVLAHIPASCAVRDYVLRAKSEAPS